MNVKTYIIGVSLLLAISLMLIVFPYLGFYQSYHIPIKNDGSVYAASDGDLGGESTHELTIEDNIAYFNCNIVKKKKYPYCKLQINLMNKDKSNKNFYNAIDFSNYDTFFLKVKNNVDVKDRIRVYLRNYDHSYSQSESSGSDLKVNKTEFYPHLNEDGIEIDMKNFNVASWWIRNMKIPPEHQGVEMDNVAMIEITSDRDVSLGKHSFEISELEFRKEYISKENLFFILVLLWMFFGFVSFVAQISKYKKQIFYSKIKEQKLREIQSTLKIEIDGVNELARRDELTGIKNRRGLTDDISHLEKRKKEKNEPFSIIFMDIDFFKKVNDTYGHDVGDIALKEFSRLIIDNIRYEDSFARWGGEEFVLLAHNSDLEQAKDLAEKLRVLVEGYSFYQGLKITSSFGISEYNHDIEKAFKKADTALYCSKANGRNKVSFKK